jgi:hypothetical protein
MKRSIRFLAIFIIFSGLLSCDDDDDPTPTPSTITFYATLNGGSEVPTNTSTATGTAKLIFNNTTKEFTITVNHNVISAIGGHIHIGAIGVNGPIVFPLTSLTSPITYTSPALTTAQEADLKEGRYYVNLHSTAFPNGEIRGQLSTNPLPNLITFYATLNGASEIPTNTSTATGTATLIFNNTTKAFTITVNHNVVSATGGHIHIGAIGVNGPIVFPLTSLTSPIAYTSPALTTAQEADLKDGRYYVNLHSTAFPDGEIRGQLDNPACNGCWDY